MLDSCVLGTTYSSAYGSGVLKVMQNETLPEIDLLVREAIQNSSDASLYQPGPFFGVNFNYSTFCPKRLNSIFEKISGILDERYPQNSADFLEIRDYKTAGLTGNTRINEIDADDHGNYFKLVFDTGKEQTNNDGGKAGGSWGYGKSVYFRMGIGLVIFYSHIKNGNDYESRLIASIVENENKTTSILKKLRSDAIGRGWWGRKPADAEDEILPITDEREIQEILDIFGIEPFGETETGTSIIIPYIDEERLLHGIFPENCNLQEDIIAMCSFKDDIVEYTKLAIQKWYAPKIDNKNLDKYSDLKRLNVRVNDEPIRYKDMRPFFRLVQELYTSALSANRNDTLTYQSPEFDGIKTVLIPSNKIEGEKAGHVSTVVVDNRALGSTGSAIPPQAYLRIFSGLAENDPIVMYARAAGMVLDYKVDGEWTKGIVKPEDSGSYMVSFFVPDCSLQVKKGVWNSGYDNNDFGEYLRRCEKSDHMDWNDDSNQTIALNIKRQVRSRINNCYKKVDNEENGGAVSRLSGKIGRKLLPQLGYGVKKKTGSGSSGGGGGSVASNFELHLVPPKYSKNNVSISFMMQFKNNRKDAFVGLFVESEIGVLDAKTWETNIKTVFPIKIIGLEKCKTFAVNTQRELMFDADCSEQNPSIRNDYSRIELVYTDNGSILGIKVKNEITNAVVLGDIILTTSDIRYCYDLKESKE